MPKNYDAVDCLWTSRGDYYISNGDIMDTSNDPLRSLVQETKTRAGSDQGDWAVYPELGASITDYVGEPNNKETCESIKIRIQSALTRNGYINSNDLKIMYMPVNAEKTLFRVKIEVLPTVLNGNSDSILLHGLYRSEEDQVCLFI